LTSTENVSLNFARVKVSYQPQGKDGKAAGGAIEMGWNIEKNVKAWTRSLVQQLPSIRQSGTPKNVAEQWYLSRAIGHDRSR